MAEVFDNPEWTEVEFARAKSFGEICPDLAAFYNRFREDAEAQHQRTATRCMFDVAEAE